MTVYGPDDLIEAGILDNVPQGHSPDQFCMAISTQMLRGQADLGAALLRVSSRGQWEMLGGFLELHELGEQLHKQRSTNFPTLMEALREGYAVGSLSDESYSSLGIKLEGNLYVARLAQPGLGLLILGSKTPVSFSPSGLKLLVNVTELWLGRREYSSIQTAGVPQVNVDNSAVIFTNRQMQVLRLLAEGKTNTEIGRQLSISASLAKQEVAFLSHAFQAKSRLDVVVQAQRQGILAVGGA